MIKPYYSYGLLAGYGYAYDESERDRDGESIAFVDQTQHALRFGVTGNFGVEWFVNSSISLLAEYGVDLYYRYSMNDRNTISYNVDGEPVNEQKSVRHELVLNPQTVRFGISAYF